MATSASVSSASLSTPAPFLSSPPVPVPSFSIQWDWADVLREFIAASASASVSQSASSKPRNSNSIGSDNKQLDASSKQFWMSVDVFGEDQKQTMIQLERQEETKSEQTATGTAAASSLTAAARSVHVHSTLPSLQCRFLNPLQVVAHESDLGLTQLLQSPRSIHTHILPGHLDILSLDVAPNASGHALAAGGEGKLRLWDYTQGLIMRDLVGHVGDVNIARFFPSSSVALSTGADRTIRIWALDSGVCAAVLKNGAHSRSVTQVQLMGRGKEFVTSAQDGTAKLWDVSKQSVLATYPAHPQSLPPKYTDCLVLDPTSHPTNLSVQGNGSNASGEDGVRPDVSDGHLLLVSGSDGLLRGFDLRARDQVLMVSTGFDGGLERLAAGPCTQSIVVGGGEGHIAVMDLRNRRPTHVMRQDDAAITQIRCWNENAIWTTNSTGACNLWQLDSASTASAASSSSSSSSPSSPVGGHIVAQLVGVDCEPIHDMILTPPASSPAHSQVLLASHRAIRCYSLSALSAINVAQNDWNLQLPLRRVA